MAEILEQPLKAKKILFTPEMERTEGFDSLPLEDLIAGQPVLFDVYLKIKDKGQTEAQLIKCWSRGEVYQEEWQKKLAGLQIPCFYVATADAGLVLEYFQQHLESQPVDNDAGNLEVATIASDATEIWTRNFFNNLEARTAGSIKQSLQFLDTLCEVLRGEPSNLLYLIKVQSQKSTRLYTHCLNVALLGLAFTSYLGWSREKSRGFGLGALVHDIGLVRVPSATLEKRGRLTPEEMLEVKRHPIESYRLLKGFVNLPMEALEMVLQHHENGDGSGYPNGLRNPGIHYWARILRILDSYEAMTAPRPWRRPMTPLDALEIMRKEWENNHAFDQYYLKSFIKFLAGQ